MLSDLQKIGLTTTRERVVIAGHKDIPKRSLTRACATLAGHRDIQERNLTRTPVITVGPRAQDKQERSLTTANTRDHPGKVDGC